MISERLKKFIFDRLYKDLGKAEIINYNGNIWFIDRGKKYWYFELEKGGTLWWRYSFFDSFFKLFCFDTTKFEPIIKDWVEEVLNYKVNTTSFYSNPSDFLVEEVLNYKVNKTSLDYDGVLSRVEEVLNHSVKEDKNTHCNYSDLPSPSAYEE